MQNILFASVFIFSIFGVPSYGQNRARSEKDLSPKVLGSNVSPHLNQWRISYYPGSRAVDQTLKGHFLKTAAFLPRPGSSGTLQQNEIASGPLGCASVPSHHPHAGVSTFFFGIWLCLTLMMGERIRRRQRFDPR